MKDSLSILVFGSVGIMGTWAFPGKQNGSLKNELCFFEAGLEIYYFNINFQLMPGF